MWCSRDRRGEGREGCELVEMEEGRDIDKLAGKVDFPQRHGKMPLASKT